MNLHIDATITYRETGPSAYGLEVRIYEVPGATPRTIPIAALESLQADPHYRYYLDISRDTDGSVRICANITAHGPESAFLQARDLALGLHRHLHLKHVEILSTAVQDQMNRLPDPGLRWVARRKAAVIAAVENGIPVVLVLHRYRMSIEELNAWRTAKAAGGLAALKAKSLRCRQA